MTLDNDQIEEQPSEQPEGEAPVDSESAPEAASAAPSRQRAPRGARAAREFLRGGSVRRQVVVQESLDRTKDVAEFRLPERTGPGTISQDPVSGVTFSTLDGRIAV